jgi:hypothetical protein
MNLVIAFSFLAALTAIVLLAYLVRMAALGGQDLASTSDWIEEISFDRYRPMLRLLDRGEVRVQYVR